MMMGDSRANAKVQALDPNAGAFIPSRMSSEPAVAIEAAATYSSPPKSLQANRHLTDSPYLSPCTASEHRESMIPSKLNFNNIDDLEFQQPGSAFPDLALIARHLIDELSDDDLDWPAINASLNRLALVRRTWRQLLAPDLKPPTATLRRQITIRSEEDASSARGWWTALKAHATLTDAALDAVVVACPNVDSFHLAFSDQITDAGFVSLAKHCKGLLSLTVGCSKLSDVGLRHIADECPELRSFNVNNCEYVTDAAIRKVAECCALENITIGNCRKLSDDAIVSIAEASARIRSLHLSYWYTLSDRAIRSVAALCPNLSSLRLFECTELTDASLTAVAGSCPLLTKLDVSRSYKFTDVSIISVAEQCSLLSSLDVVIGANLTDEALQAVARHCPELRKLSTYDCDSITDAGIILVAQNCPQLTYLGVEDCEGISHEAIDQIHKLLPKCEIKAEVDDY